MSKSGLTHTLLFAHLYEKVLFRKKSFPYSMQEFWKLCQQECRKLNLWAHPGGFGCWWMHISKIPPVLMVGSQYLHCSWFKVKYFPVPVFLCLKNAEPLQEHFLKSCGRAKLDIKTDKSLTRKVINIVFKILKKLIGKITEKRKMSTFFFLQDSGARVIVDSNF